MEGGARAPDAGTQAVDFAQHGRGDDLLGRAGRMHRALAQHHDPAPPLEPAESMDNLERVIGRLRGSGTTRILLFNMSPVVPCERIHNHQGLAEGLAQRIRRFNVALVDLSRRTGVSIVDVDAVLAREGAERLKVDAVHLTAAACRLVAEEVVRILDDLGCFAAGAVAA